MTAAPRVMILCDAAPLRCPHTYLSSPGVGTYGEARAEAKAIGWTNRVIPRASGPARSCDFCPHHEGAEPHEEP